jgi:hypothetical protein
MGLLGGWYDKTKELTMLKLKHLDAALRQEQMQERAAWKAANHATSRPAPERVSVGDAVECDLREPYPHVSRWRLLTPEAAAHANTLLATPGSGWRKTPNAAHQLEP